MFSPSGTGLSPTATVSLYQGSTLIATDTTRTPTQNWTTFTFTPSTASVTDWSDLRLRFDIAASGGGQDRAVGISWAELEAPDAPSGPVSADVSFTMGDFTLSSVAGVPTTVADVAFTMGAFTLSSTAVNTPVGLMGSVEMLEPIIVQGGAEELGRFAVAGLYSTYQAALQAVDKAISEVDFGADINEVSLFDSGSATPTQALPRNEVKTSLGQAATIAGQADWATYTGLSTTTVANRTQHQNNQGRIDDVRGYMPNRSYGLRSVYTPPTVSDTWVGTNNVTINLGASSFVNDLGNTLNLPSDSLTNKNSGTKYYIYRTMTDPTSASGSYGTSTTLAGAMANNRVYIAHWTTRATSGGTGGGGTPGGMDCVSAAAWVSASVGAVLAELAAVGEPIRTLCERTLSGSEMSPVERNSSTVEPCVTLVTESGIRLTLAAGTPLTLEDLRVVYASQGRNHRVPVEDESGFRWERIVSVEYAGPRRVAHISVGGRTYAAGDEPHRLIYTHNQVKP